jgi:hypothetical protein
MSLRHAIWSEWTKFWSVRLGGGVAIVIGAVLALIPTLVGLDGVSPPMFSYHMAHQAFTGDGSVTARVTGHEGAGPGGAAGVVLKQSPERTAPYVALILTRDRGVRLHTFRTEIAGTLTATPAWLRLVRTGDVITGFESADGTTWREVGAMTLPGLPDRIEAGLLAAAGPTGPFGCAAERTCPLSTATFDQVSLTVGVTAAPSGQPWRSVDVGEPWTPAGSFTESGGVFAVRGGGDFGPFRNFDPNIADGSLIGMLLGLPVLIAVGVLFATSEYSRGLHRVTFAATPRRWRVLAAKAIVLGGTVLVVEFLTVSAGLAWLVSNVESTGIAPIEYLHPAVVTAVLGTTATLLAVALASLAVGTLIRRPAGGIATMVALLIVPNVVAESMPVAAGRWVVLLSPVGAGAGVLASAEYTTIPAPPAGPSIVASLPVAAAALAVLVLGLLGLAAWQLRRRDA